jgi:flagellar hook assembly protein FlgD
VLSDLAAGPNPFGAETALRFTLRQPAAVGAQIFDAQGRLVRSVERQLAAGAWSLPWNGHDAAGAESPAGVYFYRVSVDGEEVGSGKLVRVE